MWRGVKQYFVSGLKIFLLGISHIRYRKTILTESELIELVLFILKNLEIYSR